MVCLLSVGGSGEAGRGNASQDFMSILAVKAAKDLQLDMTVKK